MASWGHHSLAQTRTRVLESPPIRSQSRYKPWAFLITTAVAALALLLLGSLRFDSFDTLVKDSVTLPIVAEEEKSQAFHRALFLEDQARLSLSPHPSSVGVLCNCVNACKSTSMCSPYLYTFPCLVGWCLCVRVMPCLAPF